MNGLAALAVYATAKTVTVLIEETFSIDKIADQATLRFKVCQVYHRFVSRDLHRSLHTAWNNLPVGITAYLIDMDGFLFLLGKCFFIDVLILHFRPDGPVMEHFLSNDNFPLSSMINAELLVVIHIIAYTVLITLVRAKGVKICDYLAPRVPHPFYHVLERMKDSLKCEIKDNRFNHSPKMTFKIAGFEKALGASYIIRQKEPSQEYKLWKNEAIKSKVYPSFQKFLQESVQLEGLLCDLTEDLISQPVKAPNGKVYEKGAIEDWLSRKAIEFPPERLAAMSDDARAAALLNFCPSRSCHLTSDMLTYDFTYHQKVATALKSLSDQIDDEQFKQGFLSYQTAMLNDRKAFMDDIERELTAKLTTDAISANDFVTAYNECKIRLAPIDCPAKQS